MEVFTERQPIFTKLKKLFGYELLFRSGIDNHFPDIDGDGATANILSNLFFDVNQILGNKKGGINFTRQLILDNAPLYLPCEKFIIEVFENIEPVGGASPSSNIRLSYLQESVYHQILWSFIRVLTYNLA